MARNKVTVQIRQKVFEHQIMHVDSGIEEYVDSSDAHVMPDVRWRGSCRVQSERRTYLSFSGTDAPNIAQSRRRYKRNIEM